MTQPVTPETSKLVETLHQAFTPNSLKADKTIDGVKVNQVEDELKRIESFLQRGSTLEDLTRAIERFNTFTTITIGADKEEQIKSKFFVTPALKEAFDILVATKLKELTSFSEEIEVTEHRPNKYTPKQEDIKFETIPVSEADLMLTGSPEAANVRAAKAKLDAIPLPSTTATAEEKKRIEDQRKAAKKEVDSTIATNPLRVSRAIIGAYVNKGREDFLTDQQRTLLRAAEQRDAQIRAEQRAARERGEYIRPRDYPSFYNTLMDSFLERANPQFKQEEKSKMALKMALMSLSLHPAGVQNDVSIETSDKTTGNFYHHSAKFTPTDPERLKLGLLQASPLSTFYTPAQLKDLIHRSDAKNPQIDFHSEVRKEFDPLIANQMETIKTFVKTLDLDNPEARARFISTMGIAIADNLRALVEYCTDEPLKAKAKAIIEGPLAGSEHNITKENPALYTAENCQTLQEIFLHTVDRIPYASRAYFLADYREVALNVIPTADVSSTRNKNIFHFLDQVTKTFCRGTDKDPAVMMALLIRVFNEEFKKDEGFDEKVDLLFNDPTGEKTIKAFIDAFTIPNAKKETFCNEGTLKPLFNKNESEMTRFKSILPNVRARIQIESTEATQPVISDNQIAAWKLMNILRTDPILIAGRGRNKTGENENKSHNSQDGVILGETVSTAAMTIALKGYGKGSNLTGPWDPRNIKNTSFRLYKENPGMAAFLVLTKGQKDKGKLTSQTNLGSQELNSALLMMEGESQTLTDEKIDEIIANIKQANPNLQGGFQVVEQEIRTKLGELKNVSLNDSKVSNTLFHLATKYMGLQYVDIANTFANDHKSGASGHTGHILPLLLTDGGLMKYTIEGTAADKDRRVEKMELDLSGNNFAKLCKALLTLCTSMENANHHTQEEVVVIAWQLLNSNGVDGLTITPPEGKSIEALSSLIRVDNIEETMNTLREEAKKLDGADALDENLARLREGYSDALKQFAGVDRTQAETMPGGEANDRAHSTALALSRSGSQEETLGVELADPTRTSVPVPA